MIPLEEIRAHLVDALPQECVGLVLDDGTIIRLINQARSDQRFTVGPTQLEDHLGTAARDGTGVYALYHSHVLEGGMMAKPSREDLSFVEALHQSWPHVIHIIATLTDYTIWRYHEGEIWQIREPSPAMN